ncbi:MAG: hypothetical protein WCR49_02580 [Opitutae bacterium]
MAIPAALFASWTVDASVAQSHLGGPSSYTFATKAEAQAFLNANPNVDLRIVAGGSDSAGASGGGSTIPGLPGASGPGLTGQQQLALAAAQAALPLVQQALHSLLSGTTRAPMPAPSQDQSAIAAQQLYNSGLWYLRHDDYANAQIEFEKALGRDHGNAAIQRSLDEAKRKQAQAKQAALLAAQPAAPAAPPKPIAAPSPLNVINLNNGPLAPSTTAGNPTTANSATGQNPAPRTGPATSGPATNNSSLAQLQQQSVNADFDQILSDPALKVPSPK